MLSPEDARHEAKRESARKYYLANREKILARAALKTRQKPPRIRLTDEERRAAENARNRERYANDPDFRAKKIARARRRNNERYATDPDFRARAIASAARRTESLRDDPNFRLKRQEYNRNWKAKNPDKARESNRARQARRLETCPARVRETNRAAAKKQWEKIRTDPVLRTTHNVKSDLRRALGKGVKIPEALLAAEVARRLLMLAIREAA